MRRSEWGWIAAGIALALASAITATTSAAEPSHRQRAGQTVRNRALARTDARVLLGRLMLPPGTQQARGEPAGDENALAVPAEGPPATPNVLAATTWWQVPGTPDATLAYVASHPPPGATSQQGARPGTAPGVWFETFRWPAVRGKLGARVVVVAVAPLVDGSTGVRADAQVVWLTARSAAERIPSRIAHLQVDVHRPGVSGSRERPTIVTAHRVVGRVVRLLNSLPAQQPGTSSCAVDPGVRVRLTFWSRHSPRPAAIADADLGGCEDVRLTLHGRAQHPLTGTAFPGSGRTAQPRLVDQLERALGIQLRP